MALLVLALLSAHVAATSYPLANSYAGASFFEGWDWLQSPDNTTNGNVTYVSADYATTHGMAQVYNGQVFLGVDRSTPVAYGQTRNSFKITSQEAYGVGSVFVMDATHVPFGCGVWPSFWTNGPTWPDDGEIDIFEAVNLQQGNSFTLHTANNSQCLQPPTTLQTGSTIPNNLNCSTIAKLQPEGCAVKASSPATNGQAFAQAGGGVYAAELSVMGVNIWFFQRNAIPTDLASGAQQIDTGTWGIPSANFSLASPSCSMQRSFAFQTLVLDITMCGDWAGSPTVYPVTCGNVRPGQCYQSAVVGDGSNLADAYFALNYVKVFSTNVSTTPSPSSAATAAIALVSVNPSVLPAGTHKSAANARPSLLIAILLFGATALPGLWLLV